VSISGLRLGKISTGAYLTSIMVNSMRFAQVADYESSCDSEEDFYTAEDRQRRQTTAWYVLSCFALVLVFSLAGTLLVFAVQKEKEVFNMSTSSHTSRGTQQIMSEVGGSNSSVRNHLGAMNHTDGTSHPGAMNHTNGTSYAGTPNSTGAMNHTVLRHCRQNEELYVGLCYKKCALLTDGSYPFRGTAFSCCRKGECGFLGQKTAGFVPCTGYDISGQDTCPHRPGECLENEELFFGMCYKKCSILSNGSHPYRVASATCCKTKGLNCFNFFQDKTRGAYAVGGGQGDHDPTTPKKVHAPLVQTV